MAAGAVALITGSRERRAAAQAGTHCSASRDHSTDLQSWDRSPRHPGHQAGPASLQAVPTFPGDFIFALCIQPSTYDVTICHSGVLKAAGLPTIRKAQGAPDPGAEATCDPLRGYGFSREHP